MSVLLLYLGNFPQTWKLYTRQSLGPVDVADNLIMVASLVNLSDLFEAGELQLRRDWFGVWGEGRRFRLEADDGRFDRGHFEGEVVRLARLK